jgi:2-oxoglutarate ferredoxin oxidoreductase subunit alpha
MTVQSEVRSHVTIMFAGDSGDGIQLTGSQFTDTAALFGNDISTFPNFPAEIRAPQGTLPGVSGFQLHFGSHRLYTPGDLLDVLVVMNAAALKANLRNLKPGGIIIANTEGFDIKNLKLAKYPDGENPLRNESLSAFKVFEMDVTRMTRTALAGSGMGTKEIDRSKNMFVLGYLYWMFHRDLKYTESEINEKFKKKSHLIEANIKVLRAGYNFGETSEAMASRFEVKAASLPPGEYRSITGNQAVALGLLAASNRAALPLFYGSYPITPASDILHELSKHKNFGVKTFQAEDEIAAICSAIGASFGGALGVTSSSGPGIALKTEAIGLAVMLELPLVIINIQRGGPSTGLPTKTEQADLMQAVYGRNGESPCVVIAANSPADCFNTVYEACRIAVEHMVPVFFLSDGYIANGAEPWKFPSAKDLKPISFGFAKAGPETFKPYQRNEKLVRPWAVPGVKGLEHRIGGLEKEHETGNISYDPENHQLMVKIREEKVQKVALSFPPTIPDQGKIGATLLMVGWGSTYGTIKTAVEELLQEGYSVAHLHLRYLNPLPADLESVLKASKNVIVPELNNGQLVKILREKYLIPAQAYNKIKGLPFTVSEIKELAKSKITL